MKSISSKVFGYLSHAYNCEDREKFEKNRIKEYKRIDNLCNHRCISTSAFGYDWNINDVVDALYYGNHGDIAEELLELYNNKAPDDDIRYDQDGEKDPHGTYDACGNDTWLEHNPMKPELVETDRQIILDEDAQSLIRAQKILKKISKKMISLKRTGYTNLFLDKIRKKISEKAHVSWSNAGYYVPAIYGDRTDRV